jgi:excisionase family DNA binding protein
MMPNPQNEPPPRLLTIKDVARLLQVSDKTIRRLIESRDLPAIKLGAQWRIRPRDLELFVRERLQ